MTKTLLLKMAIEIVDSPHIKVVIVHSYVSNYQRAKPMIWGILHMFDSEMFCLHEADDASCLLPAQGEHGNPWVHR